MPTQKQVYAAELNAIAQRYGTMEDQTIRRMLAMLKELRARIASQLATVDGWDAIHLQGLRANVEAQIAQFEAQFGVELKQSLQQAIQDGTDSVTVPFAAVGLPVGFHTFSTAQTNAIVDFSARLIQQIGDDMRGKIDQQIRLAVLGDKSPIDAMKAITGELGIEARAGIWGKRPDPVRGIAARAETILRTEMQRANNLASFSQQAELARNIPGMTKSWIATGDTRTRETHLRAHLQYKDAPIPVEQPFIVGGARLMYPGDPNGPPEETINCRCRSVAHHPAIGRVGSSLDGRIAAELNRR